MESGKLENLCEKAKSNGKPFRILIVDDEPWIRDVFKDFCELTDAFEVEMAGSGKEAVSKINESSFDLITLDIIMPEMSGLETLHEIKKVVPKIPVMVITGNATDKLVKEAGVLGACQVLYKPIILDEFIQVLNSTLLK